MSRVLWGILGFLPFTLLVLLNVGGYRYGVSDQAFYLPVMLQELQPDLFPLDTVLLDAQNRFLAFDDLFGWILRLSGFSLPFAFLFVYLGGLSVLYASAARMATALYSSYWAVIAFLTALAIKHRIADTAVNTLEPYLHPRLLAFAVGLSATATFLHGRSWTALLIAALALLFHPTTGLWFVILLLVAVMASDRDARHPIIALCGIIALISIGVLTSTLRSQLVIMDADWSAVLQSKDYLLATNWPLSTWFLNLGLAALIFGIYDHRRTHSLTSGRESGLIAGCFALLILFLVSVPLAHAGIAFVIQLQLNRVFWVLDVVALWYVIWFLTESPWSTQSLFSSFKNRWRRIHISHAAVVLLLISAIARGSYVSFVERSQHPLVEIDLPTTEWTEVMRWAREQPIDTHFLADPGHAWRYGSSLRTAGHRDVYLEEVKDIGIAIYSKAIAERIARRIGDLGNFDTLDASRALWLARRYRLDYLITEHSLDLPPAYEHGRFTVYKLQSNNRFSWTTSQSDSSN